MPCYAETVERWTCSSRWREYSSRNHRRKKCWRCGVEGRTTVPRNFTMENNNKMQIKCYYLYSKQKYLTSTECIQGNNHDYFSTMLICSFCLETKRSLPVLSDSPPERVNQRLIVPVWFSCLGQDSSSSIHTTDFLPLETLREALENLEGR